MSLKSRITQIAKETAEAVVAASADFRASQVQGSLGSNVGKVVSVNGNSVTIKGPDGQNSTVANTGQRYLGPGDPVVTDYTNFCL